jgi:hypothetical protein
MSQQGAASPVFVDATGRRARVVQWLARGVCATVVIAAGAVGFTLLTNVPLPGLGGLLAPGDSPRPPTSGSSTSEQSRAADDRTGDVTGTVLGTASADAASRPAARPGRDVTATSGQGAASVTAGSTPSTATTQSPTPSTPTATVGKSQAAQHANAKANVRATDKSSSPRATNGPNPRSTVKTDNASDSGAAHKRVDPDTVDPAVG